MRISISPYGVPFCLNLDRAPVILEIVERASPVFVDRSVREQPSCFEISKRQIAY